MLVDQPSFPKDAMAYAGFLLAIDSTQVDLGADHQDKLRVLDAGFAPVRPAFRRGLDVLVDHCVDAIGAQPVGEGEHPVAV
jgi:hypothetical protein